MSLDRDATGDTISTIRLFGRSCTCDRRMRQFHEHRRHVADCTLSMPGHRSRRTHVIRTRRRHRHGDARSVTRVRLVGNQHGRVDRDHVVTRGPGWCDIVLSRPAERGSRRSSRNAFCCRAAPRP